MRRALAVLLAAAVLIGCGGDDEAPRAEPDRSATSPADEPVTVVVERSRLFEQQRSLSVSVRNDGPRDVVVERVRIEARRWEAMAATDRIVTVPAGATVSFPVPYGPARCGAGDGDVVVHLVLDGTATTRRSPVGERLEREHRRECAAAAVRGAVSVSFAADWEVVAPRRVRGTLRVQARAGHRVEVVSVETSIVFVTEAAPRTGGAVRLDVVAARCDTHALIESKRTFTFTVAIEVDGAEPVPLEVVPDDGPARRALQQAIEHCIDGGTHG